jgi:hypothetical protein
MGGKDPRKLVSFRATDDEVAAIERLVKASGLSKQEYLLSAVLGAIAHTHFKNTDSSIKASSNKPLEMIAADDSSPRFRVDQEITAQSAKTYDQLWNGHYQKLGKAEYLLSNELNLLCKVKTGEASRSGKKKLGVLAYFPGDEVVFNADGTFLTATEKGFEWFTKKELEILERDRAAALEATAVVEPTNEETAIEAVNAAPSLLVEPEILNLEVPQTLTKQKFRKQFGFDGAAMNEAYGKACIKGRAKGWVSPDGIKWFTSSNSKNGEWSTDKSVVKVALATQ